MLHGFIPGLGVTAAAPPMLVWIWSGWLGPAAGGEHQAWYGSEYSEYAELLPCEHCWQQPARLFLIQLSVLPVICRSRTGQPTPHFGGKNKWSLYLKPHQHMVCDNWYRCKCSSDKSTVQYWRGAQYVEEVTRPSPHHHPHAECGGVWRQALIMTDEELDGARWRRGDTAPTHRRVNNQ